MNIYILDQSRIFIIKKMNFYQLPYTWSYPQLKCYLKIMFCSEVNFNYMSNDGMLFLTQWASLCAQFKVFKLQEHFLELNEELKKDQSTFFQNCFKESLEVGYTKDQKEFIIQGLLNSPENLMQLYFTFLLHDYLFTNDVSQCTIDVNMKFHQITNQGAPYHLLPHGIALPGYAFLSIESFQSYLSRVCDHWMNKGDFILGIDQRNMN